MFRRKIFTVVLRSRDALTIRKKKSGHLRYFRPYRITTIEKKTIGIMLDDQTICPAFKKN